MERERERWFITMGFKRDGDIWPYRFTSYISDMHPAEFAQEHQQYDDGNYWVACAVPYSGHLPTGEIEEQDVDGG